MSTTKIHKTISDANLLIHEFNGYLEYFFKCEGDWIHDVIP